MPIPKTPLTLDIDGYEVSLTFAEHDNPAALGKIKQILLSSFVSRSPSPIKKGILAFPLNQRDNIGVENDLNLDNFIPPSL